MSILLYSLIILFGSASYIVGIRQMLQGRYSPSTFSRVIWVLLSINGFAGVILSKGSTPSVLLSGIFLLGNIAICIVSFKKGTRIIGRLEYACLFLLLVSTAVWIFSDIPMLNLGISLFAHFIGAIPTYKKVWLEPKSESFGFWSLFFIASVLSLFASDFRSWGSIVFPLYFALFDGSMSLLALRKKNKENPAS